MPAIRFLASEHYYAGLTGQTQCAWFIPLASVAAGVKRRSEDQQATAVSGPLGRCPACCWWRGIRWCRVFPPGVPPRRVKCAPWTGSSTAVVDAFCAYTSECFNSVSMASENKHLTCKQSCNIIPQNYPKAFQWSFGIPRLVCGMQ